MTSQSIQYYLLIKNEQIIKFVLRLIYIYILFFYVISYLLVYILHCYKIHLNT